MKNFTQTFLLILLLSNLYFTNAQNDKMAIKNIPSLQISNELNSDSIQLLNTKKEFINSDDFYNPKDYNYSNQNYGINFLLFITLTIWIIIFIIITIKNNK